MVKCEVKTSNGFILATAPATTTTAATATTTPTATNNKAGLSLPEGHSDTTATNTTTETSPMLGNATPPVVVTDVTDDDKLDVNNKHTLLLQPLCFDPATVEAGNGSTSSGCCFFFRREKAVSGGNHRQRSRRHKTAFHQCVLATLTSTVVALSCILLLVFLKPHLFFSQNSIKEVCLTSQCVQTASYLLSAMDRNADPCDDFFQFACGSWNRKHVIPEDRSSISTFEVLADKLQIILKGVLEEDVDDLDNEATKKAKFFYHSCMDLPRIVEVSDAPLRRVIKQLGGWPVADPTWDPNNTLPLEQLIAVLKRNFTLGVIVEEWVGPDDRNSLGHVIQIDQMQLGLPSRDYFLHQESKRDLEAYHQYMTDVSVLLGAERENASEELWLCIEFEKKLANISVPEVSRIDTGAIYNKLTIRELQENISAIDWLKYFTHLVEPMEITEDEEIVSYSTAFFMRLGEVIQSTDKRTIHNYVIWRLVMDLMPHLPPQYEATRSEFRRVLLGVLTDRNRWNRCVEWTNKKLGMAVGALFIRDHFNHESKATALEMIHEIRHAFNDLLEENEWMDVETRLVAEDKANSMNERIGYPEYITNTTRLEEEYQNLKTQNDTFLENLFSILNFEAERNIAKLRKAVDKDKWATEPAVVNAFYNPNKNDIVFPAGILQPLFYSQHFPKSLNYGGIGVVIGHEITHGFDDKGRQFDKHGNLKQWWNNRTIAAFRTAAECIVEQYSNYTLEEVNLPIDGRLTQGENIADNGGLKQAFRAYRKWVAKHGEEPALPGLNLNHDQLFFLNYAQIWCGSMRPEDALTKIRSSVHSPGPIRVLGPLSNSKDFAKAYQCEPGSRMNPIEKCSVW